MPEFIKEFIDALNTKKPRIIEDFKSIKLVDIFKDEFAKFWIDYNLKKARPGQNILAIDSSRGLIPFGNGGFFHVVRALGIVRNIRYPYVFTDFDFGQPLRMYNYIGRVMEWAEHKVAINAIKDGFNGYILVDGSIYGRLVHLPLELELINNKSFMIHYFETLIELLDLCKNKNIPFIGVSKESRTGFFKEFLIKEILKKIIPDEQFLGELVSLGLENKRKAIEIARKTGDDQIISLINELVYKKPDALLILNNALNSGYTHPLLLGASQRWRRASKMISRDPKEYIRKNFPLSSLDNNFLNFAQDIVKKMLDFPAIVSFHLLPKINDTPIRIDIPDWYFDLDSKLIEIGWPQIVDIDLEEILNLISAGYCGLDNYNIWLKFVDDNVKLKRNILENIYLQKFEEIISKKATSRGYRRVRYP
ncbi:MAG: DNA double-strand break repair nuclease NurA [Candidatus Helarchaeota archaeon]